MQAYVCRYIDDGFGWYCCFLTCAQTCAVWLDVDVIISMVVEFMILIFVFVVCYFLKISLITCLNTKTKIYMIFKKILGLTAFECSDLCI